MNVLVQLYMITDCTVCRLFVFSIIKGWHLKFAAEIQMAIWAWNLGFWLGYFWGCRSAWSYCVTRSHLPTVTAQHPRRLESAVQVLVEECSCWCQPCEGGFIKWLSVLPHLRYGISPRTLWNYCLIGCEKEILFWWSLGAGVILTAIPSVS